MKRKVLSAEDVAAHWDRNAELWAGHVRRGLDVYREYFNNPAFLEFIGDPKGMSVLDAGCGEGYNTRILARNGAKMAGVDISPRMVALARQEEAREPLGIRYEVASFSDLSLFAAASFDVVVSFMALMDGPDFAGAAGEIFRVLRPGGLLIFSMTHPCFNTRGYGWIEDGQSNAIKLTVSDYFDEESNLTQWRFKGVSPDEAAPFVVPRFPRTLSSYLNRLIGAGFGLQRIEEPRPTAEACLKQPALQRWRDHAAIFLYVRAVKPS